MTAKSTDLKREIHFTSTEKEPRFVAAYNVAIALGDAFEATLETLGNVPIANNRELESLRCISLY